MKKNKKKWSRRSMLQTVGAGAAATWASSRAAAAAGLEEPYKVKGNIKQSACQWCYKTTPLEELAAGAARIGLKSVELIGPEQFKVVKNYGLTCGMTWGAGPIRDCLNRKENHDRCERDLRRNIEFAAAEGIPNVICFSGNRNGMPDDEGLENCLIGIKRVIGFAEKKGITICIEALNSKVNHKDYMADSSAWCLELIKRVGSPRFKLLYDIYHMQIMEGDVIRTLRENKDYIAHYHTGGVPGRHEIDETQELYYPAIITAILETGYTGFLGQEFIPTRDPLSSLAQGFRICDV
ncbi:MAG: hydroxypyruvate isomerase family protein [Acidobacteriota bacterium]